MYIFKPFDRKLNNLWFIGRAEKLIHIIDPSVIQMLQDDFFDLEYASNDDASSSPIPRKKKKKRKKKKAPPSPLNSLNPQQQAIKLKLDTWLAKGASLDARKARTTIMLHEAAYVGHFEATRALLGNPHIRVLQERDYSPYIDAVSVNCPLLNPTIHPVMALHVATYFAPQCTDGSLVLSLLLNHPHTDVNRGPIQPILIAAFQGNLPVVKQLVQHGADIEANIFHYVCTRYKLTTKEVVHWCYQKCGISNANMDSIYHTPLMIAVGRNYSNMVEYLLSLGADLKMDIDELETPLMIAAYKGHEQCVDLLLKCCKKRATRYSALDIAQYVNKSCNILGVRTNPLIQASQEGHLGVVKQLLAAGASINATRSDGITALRIAEEMKHADVAMVLRQQAILAQVI